MVIHEITTQKVTQILQHYFSGTTMKIIEAVIGNLIRCILSPITFYNNSQGAKYWIIGEILYSLNKPPYLYLYYINTACNYLSEYYDEFKEKPLKIYRYS